MINRRMRRLERAYTERGTWLLLREKKITELEQELERMQAIAGLLPRFDKVMMDISIILLPTIITALSIILANRRW